MDFRDGGIFRVCMRGFGKDHWMNGVFREIVKNERIVWTAMLDNDMNEVVTTVTSPLSAARPNSPCTRPTRSKPIRLAVHHRGWTETLDHLAELLAERMTQTRLKENNHGSSS